MRLEKLEMELVKRYGMADSGGIDSVEVLEEAKCLTMLSVFWRPNRCTNCTFRDEQETGFG